MPQLNPDDSDSIMMEVGEIVPVILREAMDNGFDAFRRSRALDAAAYATYSPTTLAGMLTDRIYPFLVELTALVDPQGLQLRRGGPEMIEQRNCLWGRISTLKLSESKTSTAPLRRKMTLKWME